MAALLGTNGAIVLIFLAFIFNMVIVVKTLYKNLSRKKRDKQFIWSLISSALISIGTLSSFIWFIRLYLPSTGFLGFFGFLFLCVNNIIATVYIFKSETDFLKRMGGIIFSFMALYSTLILLNVIASYTVLNLPRFLNWILTIPSISYGLLQALFFTGGTAYWYPLFILIPIAIPIDLFEKGKIKSVDEEKKQISKKAVSQEKKGEKVSRKKSTVFLERIEKEQEKKEKRGIGTFLSNGVKGIFVFIVLFLIIFSMIGVGVLSSLSQYTAKNYQPTYIQREDFSFAVSLRTGSFQTFLPSNYEEIFSLELDLIRELGVDTVSIDVLTDIILANQTSFGNMLNALKSEGLKIALFAYGNATWSYPYESFANYSNTIEMEAQMIVENYEPDYLVIYPQPIVFQTYFMNPEETITNNDWTQAINNTANLIHSLSNKTKVAVSVTLDDIDSGLFDNLWNSTTIDLAIINIYVYQDRDLNFDEYLNITVQANKTVWISSTSFSPMMYGERIQAGTLARQLEIVVNNQKITGFICDPLMDRTITANLNGLVAENGHKRLAFYKYKEVIKAVKE
ncbi:MAG: hypothetical protein K9W45_13340 [Candidatus Heimdallarchaeum aukensis]|uniref:Uncharacterized protein n=1 Tax=Candidatus Heimdallarchaeum aukensis TaxID=2876573 RepID=A0A9Y1BL15_9ARCH|nr:MAG: hypothetical protein K9W45_13340 [Candidatus Heimdallarchaeum aukensis]